MGESLALWCGRQTVGRYVHRPDLPARLSPRPYLHPVTTLSGVPVTEFMPADHLHHLGVSIAIPDVEGRNFWGGSTFVRGQGPTERDNHGVQQHTRWISRSAAGFAQELSWSAGGSELFHERRAVRIRQLSPTAWGLDLTFTLTNTAGRPLDIGSPATNGRPGAGYGGFFWRAPRSGEQPRIFTARADGEEAAHGCREDWLAMGGDGWTLVFGGADPWFVRSGEYPGVGSALCWAQPLTVPPAGTLTRRITTAVADGRLGRDEAAAVAHLSTCGSPP